MHDYKKYETACINYTNVIKITIAISIIIRLEMYQVSRVGIIYSCVNKALFSEFKTEIDGTALLCFNILRQQILDSLF